MPYIEYVGTIASVVVAVSLMMKNLKRLRLLNLAGSAIFAAYGAAIGSIPVCALNTFCVAVDLWYLVKMRRERFSFALMRVDPDDSPYLESFLGYYMKDIGNFAPEFAQADLQNAKAVFVLRNMIPASLVIYRESSEGYVELLLDYASPAYRDYKNAEYFFSVAAREIASEGSKRDSTIFRTKASKAAHTAYLERMGFKRMEARNGEADRWELSLKNQAIF